MILNLKQPICAKWKPQSNRFAFAKCAKATVESDISRKDASQLPASLLNVSFFQNGFSHTFCWSKSISKASDISPVDTQLCLQGTG